MPSDAIDTDLAAELGLPVAGALSATGAGELPVEIGLTRAAQVEIGDVTPDRSAVPRTAAEPDRGRRPAGLSRIARL
ncbi:MAG: hypothetical protein WDN69_32495 [Aliidongia sp.]